MSWLPALVFFTSGCLTYREVEVGGVTDVRIKEFSGNSVVIQATVVVNNPNGYRIKLKEPDIDLFVDHMRIGRATPDSVLVLRPRSRETYTLPLRADLDGSAGPMLLPLLGAWSKGQVTVGAKGSVIGKALLIRKRVPFEIEQVVEIPR